MVRIRSLLAVLALTVAASAAAAPLPGGTLIPTNVPKYTEQLPIPPRFTPGQLTTVDPATGTNVVLPYYDLAAGPKVQQVLPTVNGAGKPLKTPYPPTPVWGYGDTKAKSFSWPAATIEVTQGAPAAVTWRNQLVDAAGKAVPHLFTIDPTLHWANPAGPVDTRPEFLATPAPYGGPVPLVTHLHGGHVDPLSDGFPEAWYLPASGYTACTNLSSQAGTPAGCYFPKGSNYGNAPGVPVIPGAATYLYRNDQRATTLWYHDHVLGMTRANVYAGLAGFYLVRDAYEQQTLGLASQYPYGTYELPLLIQDRSFNADGTLFYPTSRVFFDGFAGPYLPTPDISPYWNPEFFGNFMVVNGKTWPKLPVEARKYRLRLLNGCDSRWLILTFSDANLKPLPVTFNVIGNDGGFLTGAPVATKQLVMAPGERYDVIVDFSAVPVGTRVVLENVGPDSPYGGGNVSGAALADPGTTGQVMAFDVKAATTVNPALPVSLSPPLDPFMPGPIAGLTPTNPPRTVTLTEFASLVNPAGPSEAQVGDAWGPHPWMAAGTENVTLDARGQAVEVWQIVNRTVDAHPIHLHQTEFQILDRTPLNLAAYDAQVATCKATPTALGCPADPWAFVKKGTVSAPPAPYETGQKDTVMTRPGEITRVKTFFDIPGQYVWHCHILSHEDNEMMRPLCVGPSTGCVK
ncbi:MAG TPA: multicopper oxidase domain-containing protein [Anaeromyxobacteraceae bacterium]|nr:multicopper oxidase domain-containing protein [Anaeromyxobacteraceae bacterium]